MPTIPIPNGVMVELIYSYNGQRIENVYHATKGSPANVADLNALVTLFRTWENGTAKARRSVACSLVQIDATALDGPGAPVVTVPILPAIAGTHASSAAPCYTTIAIKHTSGLGGRSFRGRTYWIGVGQAWLGGGDLIAQSEADLVAGYYNTLRTQLLAGGWTFCIASKYSGVVIVNGRRRAVPRAQGILTPVLASTCERGLDTNRHRKLPYQV